MIDFIILGVSFLNLFLGIFWINIFYLSMNEKTKLKEILRDLLDLLEMFCKPKQTSIYFLDKNNPEISF